MNVLEVNYPVFFRLIYFKAIKCRDAYRVIYTTDDIHSGDQIKRMLIFPRYLTLYIYIPRYISTITYRGFGFSDIHDDVLFDTSVPQTTVPG